MRVSLVSKRSPGFTVRAPLTQPLGGTQSALCYLAVELAQRGHHVTLHSDIHKEVLQDGVLCVPIGCHLGASIRSARPDVVVLSQFEEDTRRLRRALRLPIVVWYVTAPGFVAHNAKAMAAHEGEHGFDQAVFVSRWHRDEMVKAHGIPEDRAHFVHNGVAPPFLYDGLSPEELVAAKAYPLHLAYASTPFRGLDLLCELCENELAGEEALIADVFSSMKVYEGDDDPYRGLYERIRRSPRMRLHGSIGQRALAETLRGAAVLAYPNTYPETFCIAAAEAMAAGCHVITSALGALPEVTGGFATLLPPPGDRVAYRQAFAKALRTWRDGVTGADAAAHKVRLAEQIRFVRARYAWPVLAVEWERLLRLAAAR